MKKTLAILMSCLMLFSLVSLVPASSFAASANKLHISFAQMPEEELTALTNEEGYHIRVFFTFAYEDIADETLDAAGAEGRRAAVMDHYRPRNEALAQKLGLDAEFSYFAACAEKIYPDIAAFRKDEAFLRKLVRKRQIKEIVADLQKVENTSSREDTYSGMDYSYTAIQNDIIGQPYYDYLGTGIRVGVLEVGYPTLTSHLTNQVTTEGYPETAEVRHASTVCTIIGKMAPFADLYCFGVGEDISWITALNWLIGTCDVHVINISAEYGYEDNWSTNISPISDWPVYEKASAYLDGIINRTGCQIVKSAGNYGNDIGRNYVGMVSHPGFGMNSITVGSSTVNKKVAFHSSYICNTPQINKPDLVAPGENIRMDTLDTYISPNVAGIYDGYYTGTSFAAPFVTGIIARLLHQFTYLKTQPLLLKAILMESCTPLNGQTGGIDPYGGAGLVNFQNARNIAANTARRRAVSGDTITSSGVTFYPIVPAGATLSFRIAIGVSGHTDTALYNPLVQADAVLSQYAVRVESASGLAYLTATTGASTAYYTYTNTSNEEKILRVTIRPAGALSACVGETLVYTHNMNTCHISHSYSNCQPYTKTLHRTWCVCGEYRSDCHHFVPTGSYDTCTDCGYKNKPGGGGSTIEPWQTGATES